MKKLLLLTAFLLAGYFSYANRLLVKSNGAGFAYTSIGEAIDSAQVDDTIVIFPRTDGQQWSLTKTLTKPMVFLNGDTASGIQTVFGNISLSNGKKIGTVIFSDLAVTVFNSSINGIIFNRCSAGISGKKYTAYDSQISFNGNVDSSNFYYSRISSSSVSLSNSTLIGCTVSSIGGTTNCNFISNYFQSGIGIVNNSNLVNNTIETTSLQLINNDNDYSTYFCNNYLHCNLTNVGFLNVNIEGNYFLSKNAGVQIPNGFKQAPANIQLDSIGRIVGNALVDSGATTPWLRDVDGSPADVGITGGPFPIQNYINPNPGNAQIIHVNIPNRVGFPNRPIPIKATGTSK